MTRSLHAPQTSLPAAERAERPPLTVVPERASATGFGRWARSVIVMGVGTLTIATAVYFVFGWVPMELTTFTLCVASAAVSCAMVRTMTRQIIAAADGPALGAPASKVAAAK